MNACIFTGFLASTTKIAAVTTSASTPPITCPKCGATNLGKLSCCFRGATWFKKCGDVGDPNFEHTWFDGIQACKGKLTS